MYVLVNKKCPVKTQASSGRSARGVENGGDSNMIGSIVSFLKTFVFTEKNRTHLVFRNGVALY